MGHIIINYNKMDNPKKQNDTIKNDSLFNKFEDISIKKIQELSALEKSIDKALNQWKMKDYNK